MGDEFGALQEEAFLNGLEWYKGISDAEGGLVFISEFIEMQEEVDFSDDDDFEGCEKEDEFWIWWRIGPDGDVLFVIDEF